MPGKVPKLIAVRIGSARHLELIRSGWRTRHVDGQITWLEFPVFVVQADQVPNTVTEYAGNNNMVAETTYFRCRKQNRAVVLLYRGNVKRSFYPTYKVPVRQQCRLEDM